VKVSLEISVRVECSWRYGVMGVYRDRDLPVVRVYPLPFVRITIEWGSEVAE
jgi:hypothetical protein